MIYFIKLPKLKKHHKLKIHACQLT